MKIQGGDIVATCTPLVVGAGIFPYLWQKPRDDQKGSGDGPTSDDVMDGVWGSASAAIPRIQT